jgi:uncharacterized membrane protein
VVLALREHPAAVVAVIVYVCVVAGVATVVYVVVELNPVDGVQLKEGPAGPAVSVTGIPAQVEYDAAMLK